MPFLKEDFAGDTITRLSVICMVKIGKHPLLNFKLLMEKDKKRFNKVMNEYISSLGDSWESKLLADFNEVCNDEIYNEEFKQEVQFIKELNTDIQCLDKPEGMYWLDNPPETPDQPLPELLLDERA
jgi:hypothetical protein